MPEAPVSGLSALASLLLPAGFSLLVVAGLVLLFRRRLRLAVPAGLALAGSCLLWLAHGYGADGRAQGTQVQKVIRCENRKVHPPGLSRATACPGRGENRRSEGEDDVRTGSE